MANRRRITKEDLEKRKEYLEEHGCCEICGSAYLVAVHHHIKQQKETIESFNNYTALCRFKCHAKYHANKKQFCREVRIHPRSKFAGMDIGDLYDYLSKLKEINPGEAGYVRGV